MHVYCCGILELSREGSEFFVFLISVSSSNVASALGCCPHSGECREVVH